MAERGPTPSGDRVGEAPSASPDRFARGLEMRRRVLGREYVDAALARVDDFARPLQELVTEYAWGSVWTRPGLDPRTRSLVTIAMLIGLNRPDELRLHVGAAIRNGCSREEIREVILHSAIYLGVPAALPALEVARTALAADPTDGPDATR